MHGRWLLVVQALYSYPAQQRLAKERQREAIDNGAAYRRPTTAERQACTRDFG